MKIVSVPYVFLMLVVVVVTSCERNNNTPGYNYFPDMAYSRAYETYSENPNFNDGKTMREPEPGTVPRGIVPFPYEKTEEDLARAGKELSNPFVFSAEMLARGKEMYTWMCQQCHGEEGDGLGFLYTEKLYTYPPASLIAGQAVNRSDGEIYHVITVGKNVMGAHGSLIRPEDRWKIVMYVRKLQIEADSKEDGIQIEIEN